MAPPRWQFKFCTSVNRTALLLLLLLLLRHQSIRL
jgi:hypothetical protein